MISSGLLVTPGVSCLSALPCPALSSLKTVIWVYVLVSMFLVPPCCVHRDKFQMKCKIYLHLKRGLWTTEFFFSTAPGKTLLTLSLVQKRQPGLLALFLKTSEHGDSWCTDSSFSPLLVKLSQVFESALLDSILKLAVIPAACAPLPTQILPSSQLCI